MKLYTGECEVGDIFRFYFNQYVQQYGPLPKHYYDAANAIMHCRTEQLGGHIYKCDTCSHEIILYNSCRNRHCPKCQAMARAQWVEQRMSEVLPLTYYHVVFTIPHQLNSIALRNKKPFYQLMFKAVSETLIALGNDPKYLGGQIGFITVMHTWGQNLMDHPHIHCIVPAGALNTRDNTWKTGKENYLFPVAVMQKLFRGKCMDYFLKAVDDGTIKPLFSATPQLPSFKALVDKLYAINWVVYIKEPFTSPLNLIKYIARYIHRIAISNKRILKIENGCVTFSYKDYADNNTRKTMTITAVEFIRRFMLHILPEGFMRIRQYGFLSNAAKKKKLARIRKLIQEMPDTKTETHNDKENNEDTAPHHPFECPQCKKGTLVKYKEVTAIKYSEAKVVND
jgi:hypothetical protein